MEIDFLACPWCSDGLLYRKRGHHNKSDNLQGQHVLEESSQQPTIFQRKGEFFCPDCKTTCEEYFSYGCTNDSQCDGKLIVQSDSSLSFSGMNYYCVIAKFFNALDKHMCVCPLSIRTDTNDVDVTTTEISEEPRGNKKRKIDFPLENPPASNCGPSRAIEECDSKLRSIQCSHKVFREQPLLFVPSVTSPQGDQTNTLDASNCLQEKVALHGVDNNVPVFYLMECSAGKEPLKLFIL